MSDIRSGSARPAIQTVTDLIGREELLNNIMQKLQSVDRTPQLIWLTGEGGIGKTRLLYAVAESCRANGNYQVATQEIDCYDQNNHSKQQFAAELAKVMPEEVDLAAYHQAVRELQRAEQRNDPTIGTYHSKVEDALRTELEKASQQQRLIIMLDTMERFVYVTGSTHDEAQIASNWNWITEKLLSIPNISWIVAGRSTAEYLFRDIEVSKIPVPDFTEKGAHDYIEALIVRARKENNEVVADRLQTLLTTDLFPIIYQQSAGRPLTLALLADLMTITNLPSTNMQATQQAIINHLMEVEELGVMLRVLGRLRRGADLRMLRAVLSTIERWPVERTSQIFDEFKHLSFVKKPRGERYFLHDIMYEWLDQYLYKEPREHRDGSKVYSAAINFCKDQEIHISQELDTIFFHLEQGRGRFDPEVYTNTRNHRRQALLDRLYYELCHKPLDCWRFYLRYTFDAILGGDPTLDMLLLAQMLNGLTELDSRSQLRKSGLTFEIVRGVALIRPVARAFAENDFVRANAEAEKIQKTAPSSRPDELRTSPMIDIWHAASLVQLAGADNLERAENLIHNAITRIEALLKDRTTSPEEKAEDIRELVGVTFAYQILGDYYRQRDQIQEAFHAYRYAVKYGRESRVLIILLLSLTRLGLVLNRLGNFDDAVALIEDALDMRLQIGLPNLIAAAYSSLGIVLTSQGNYQSAIDNLEKTVAIYRALGHTLGVAQNQANLSEAKRRYAGSVGMRATQEGVRLLHEAISFAEEAGVSAEQSASARTIVRANIELGCALRALARETYEGKVRTASSLQRLIIESENALRKAASHAYEKALPVLHLDALANIPFLYYYVNNVTKAKHSLDEIWGYVPQNYLIQPSLIEPVLGSEPQIAFWRHIAKLTTLQGHIAYDRFQEFLHDEDLRQCAEAYMLAMEYNERYSHDEMGIQNSRQQIYDRLRKLDVQVLRRFALYVQEHAANYGFTETNLQKRLDMRTLWFA